MTNKNQVTLTPNTFYGYIDESAPCGKAKAKQVQADMETLATILQDTNLTEKTKRAIYLDYSKAIKEYVEREETCGDCTNEECDDYEEENEEYEAVVIIEDMDNFVISTNGTVIECDTYEETVHKIVLLELLGLPYDVYAYDNEDNEYSCRLADNDGLVLEIAD